LFGASDREEEMAKRVRVEVRTVLGTFILSWGTKSGHGLASAVCYDPRIRQAEVRRYIKYRAGP